MATVPHFQLPLSVDSDGSFMTIEQDSVDEIAQCVAVLMKTPVGSREELPGYGIPRLAFLTTIPHDAIMAAVDRWEPRARTTSTDARDVVDEMITDLEVMVDRGSV